MANDIKISDIAKELGAEAKEIVEKAKELNLDLKPTDKVSADKAAMLYDFITTGEIPKSLKKPAANKKIQKVQKAVKKPADDTKTTNKVVPTKAPKTEVKKETPKVETINKEKEIKKEEPVKKENEPKKESLGLNVAKRRGLVIVKKKKQEPKATPKVSRAEIIDDRLVSMFGNSSSTPAPKKKKETKKRPVTARKDNSSKIDLAVDFSADVVLEDENIVVLPDLTVKPIEIEQQAPLKKNTNQPNQGFKGAKKAGVNNFNNSISRKGRKKHKKNLKAGKSEEITEVEIPNEIRLYEFADKIGKSVGEVMSKLFALGKLTTKNDFLDEDEIEILGEEFEIEVNVINEQDEFDYVADYDEQDDEKDLQTRAPVVTIMGHVDHGKTSLLDYIRSSRVATGEAGGITQHVGAYMVEKGDRKITFIDTPGHEAFTSMRERGADVTDVVIIVVAADDGVKPQTIEAINHAKAANVPIIIAINKMDKENANPDNVKSGLSQHDILPLDWGGEYECIPISAKTGMGVDDLLEVVLLQADLLELKANPNRLAKATIVESSLQKGRGPVATIIVENGTLRVGDTIVAGVAYGKVRAMNDDQGANLKEIGPGECGVIIGLSEVPEAGEILMGVETDKEARDYAQKKYEYMRQKELSKSTKVTIDELSAKIAEGELKTLPVIIKTDVQGSLEAIKASLEKLQNDEIKVNIIHSGVGGISQSDVGLAAASDNCVILGFNIRPTGTVKSDAKDRGVEIKTYSVIYDLIDDVKAILSGLMSPIISEEDLGQAVVKQVINVPKIGQIAGCMVTEGNIVRGAKIRVIRDGVVIFEGNISSLKRFKDDVKEVAKGYECGVGIEGYNDMKEGDYIESFKEVETKVEL